MTKTVSVVITCYKYAQFLPFALDSVLAQSYRDIEVVVVNDGSPDHTDEVMERYRSDPRVVYIKQANAGQAVAKNNGIRAASGAFVAFLDADDIWCADKLEKQMALFANPAVGVVYSDMSFIDEAGEAVPYHPKAIATPRAGHIAEYLFVDNIVPFSSAVVRRECFDKCGVMDTSLRMAIDWDLWLRMSVDYEFDFVGEPLLQYRIGHAGQMSKNYAVREIDQMRIMQKFISANPTVIPRSLLRWVMAYSCCNRGYHFRTTDGLKSLTYYLDAIRWRWNHATAYAGILKLLAVKAMQVFHVRRQTS